MVGYARDGLTKY